MTPFHGKLKIRHLEIVLAIADSGNLSKAAQQLHSTQSALSRALAEIEELLGGRLYERTGKGMACTPLGEAMCRHGRVLLGDLRKAEMDLAAIGRGEQGSLVVGCFSLFSGWPLTDTARRFRERHPDIALTITTGNHDDLLADLDSGALDVFLSRARPTMNPDIYRADPIITDPVALTCAPHHPLATGHATLADCVAYPWITALPGSRIQRELESNLSQAGLALPATIGALSLEFGRDFIRDARHLWMLPGCVAAAMQARGEVHVLPVELGLLPAPMAAIWRRDRPGSRHMRAFADALAEVVEQAGLPYGP
ncbi:MULTISPECIES: LysR family transcriptional regulator [Pigmentiphaga]|uniref:LysR family transcriptional regulator n=1 Tax=Pigmentiphaga daeguensis TaxID=414049 RepID=A0ABN1CWR1_9BURK|nr:LysR family transcriptional regulator [Pigmentiphaga sp. D-2]